MGTPGRARGLPQARGVRGCAALRLAPPHLPRGMGLCQSLEQQFLKFEVNTLCSLSGLLTLGLECGHFAETLKEAQNVSFIEKCHQTPLSPAGDRHPQRLSLLRNLAPFLTGLSGARLVGCHCWGPPRPQGTQPAVPDESCARPEVSLSLCGRCRPDVNKAHGTSLELGKPWGPPGRRSGRLGKLPQFFLKYLGVAAVARWLSQLDS